MKKYNEMTKRNRNRLFIFMTILFSIALFWTYFEGKTSEINTTMLAFNYKFGFISRGLLGSIYSGLNMILPFDLKNSTSSMLFFDMCYVMFCLILFWFIGLCINRISKDNEKNAKYIAILYVVFAIPMFCSRYNFGRLDMFCLMCSLLSMILLIVRKAEWLVIPLSALGVMFHQGDVFMFVGMVLVLLVYRIIIEENRKKYIIIFALTFIIVSALFLWFEFFSRYNGEMIYEEIINNSKVLHTEGKYHKDVIDHEIRGIDLSEKEWEWHKENMVEFPIFLLFFLPYIIILVKFFVRLIKRTSTGAEKLNYIMVAIGSITILPDMILKVDFGRWVFAVISYYCIVILSLLAIGDKYVKEEVAYTISSLKKNYDFAIILMIYPMIFQPLKHINISNVTERVADIVNEYFNIWVD